MVNIFHTGWANYVGEYTYMTVNYGTITHCDVTGRVDIESIVPCFINSTKNGNIYDQTSVIVLKFWA